MAVQQLGREEALRKILSQRNAPASGIGAYVTTPVQAAAGSGIGAVDPTLDYGLDSEMSGNIAIDGGPATEIPFVTPGFYTGMGEAVGKGLSSVFGYKGPSDEKTQREAIQSYINRDIPQMTDKERADMQADEAAGIDSQLKQISQSLAERAPADTVPSAVSEGAFDDGQKTKATETETKTEVTETQTKTDDPLEPFGGAGDDVQDDADKASPYDEILQYAMEDVERIRGEEPKGTIDDYKKEFARVTGVDISGKADKGQALMALGLSLMQNKAGKGFNVSNALAAIGKAGEAAAPAFQKAKEAARAAQISAGKYALGQVAKDDAAKAARLQAAQERVQELLKGRQDDIAAQVLKQQEHQYALQLQELENKGKVSAANAKAGADASKLQFDFTGEKTFNPVVSLPNVKVFKANRKSDGKAVYTKPEDSARLLAGAYADSLDGISSLDTMIDLTRQASQLAAGGLTGQKMYEWWRGKAQSLGFDVGVDAITGEKLGPLAEAEAIRKRIIAQYKRFLTQETGNGISEGDVQRLEQALGTANWFENPNLLIEQLSQTRKLFEGTRDATQRELIALGDRDSYLDPTAFDKTQKIISEAALTGINEGLGGNLLQTTDEDGIITIKLS